MIFKAILLAAVLAWGLGAGHQAQAQETGRTMIIMDGSGSMWGRIGKNPKLRIAKRAVNQFMKLLPNDLEVGLMAYGHRREGDCDDIQVLVKPQEKSDAKIRKALAGMKFVGKTPIGASLEAAAEALNFEDEPATIILVTDGTESCKANPCAVASDLEAAGFDLTVHVVGFGVKPAEGRKLTCIANRTGGKYYPARNARALAAALEAAMSDADTEESEEFAGMEPEVAPAGEETAPIPGVAYYRGAPVMLNTVLNPVGNIGIVAQAPRAQSFPPDGQISDCQAICEGEPLCAAWRYDPKGATAAGTAICTMYDYAAALDYADVDPTAGYASGMKVAAVQLVRPYVPAPVVAVADAEAASAPVTVTIAASNAPEGLSIAWQAIPLNDPEGASIAAEETVAGGWQIDLTPGEYAIEGSAEGWFFEGYILVAADATEFQIDGTQTAVEVASVEESAEESAETEAVDDTMDVDEADETPVQTTNTPPVGETVDQLPVTSPQPVVTVDAAQTLGLGGAGTVSAAGYRCDADQACGFQNEATGLVFALPPGWGSDTPGPAPAAEGTTSDLVGMTFFGPEGADGSLPTLLLNPLGWVPANGDCVETGAGQLCAWGAATEVLQAGIDQIAPSLIVADAVESPTETPVTEPVPTKTVANEPTTPTGPSASPSSTNPGSETPATEVMQSTEPAPAANAVSPADGNWSGKADPVAVSQCPAGFDKALDPILASLTAARPIVWGGRFDGDAMALPGVVWQPDEAGLAGNAPPVPVEGLPPFILAVLEAKATMVDADHVTGDLAMTFFADGSGTIGLLNAGLQSCRLTATFALVRGN